MKDYIEDNKERKREKKRVTREDRSKFKKTDREKREPLLEEKFKLRMAKETLFQGRVLSILPEQIDVEHENLVYKCVLKGNLKNEVRKVRNLVVVGDFVLFDPKTCAIHFIEKRKSLLSKRASNKNEQLIAANIDLVLITTSWSDPPLNLPLIDRYIIATRKGNMAPVIIINKIDLLKKSEKPFYDHLEALFSSLDFPLIFLSTKTKQGMDGLKQIMKDRASVFVGESGVGKTSLINMVTDLNLPTKEVTEKLKRGVHTTTRAHLVPLTFGGWCIDTPGIQKFGLWDLKREDLDDYFSDITLLKEQCHYADCTHTHEPNCYLQQALKEKKISPLRFDSYLNLLKEL